MKYKIVDRKVRPIATPLLEDSWEQMKGVAIDPNLQDPTGLGHLFSDVTLRTLKVGGVAYYCPWRRTSSRGCSKGPRKPLHSRRGRSGAPTRQ